MPIIIFPLIALLIAFAILGFYDIIGLGRIDFRVIVLFACIFFLIFLYQTGFSINSYTATTPKWQIAATILSMIVFIALPRLGIGDKIFVAITFLVYPFWLIWLIVIFAQALITPFFKIIMKFRNSSAATLPFYPFLFLSALIIYVIADHFGIFTYVPYFSIPRI
ncbi:MAG: hypothetical protein KGH64_02740 [Candidatus Micrarchaeota archaeon]|nr:hypothetical protein [Candidatus Micrarchaeota archaeon]MDE1834230.1 hypothetical protein [Candidatus Micrarchaeota archaeon]MDE1859299.1 hypothetical protein [Candidatus Micrarchaeota archaeon]